MQSNPIDLPLMQEQVRAIYRAATGSELVEASVPHAEPAPPIEDVALRFADLEALVRGIPSVSARVPPYSFVPLIDVTQDGADWLIEVAVPGAQPSEVSVELAGGQLWISGVRRGTGSSDRRYLHAEIPRGPFRRSIELPADRVGAPRVQIRDGLIAIRIARDPSASVP